MGWERIETPSPNDLASCRGASLCEVCENSTVWNNSESFRDLHIENGKIFETLSFEPLDFHWRFDQRTSKAPFYNQGSCELVKKLFLAKKASFFILSHLSRFFILTVSQTQLFMKNAEYGVDQLYGPI